MLEKNYHQSRYSKITSPKNLTTYNNNGQRVSLKRRGKTRYFCYIQDRYFDIYCCIQSSIGVPILKDGFINENLSFVHNNIKEVEKYLKNLSQEKQKQITFSLNSIKVSSL